LAHLLYPSAAPPKIDLRTHSKSRDVPNLFDLRS
jgi:hypothetical protein